ncbi:barstar family protein [Clostridium sp.]|uniref:barstar family protein n=1 Tax=Clostridium sp. TaxID=1506 RepID=UPI003464A3E0
MKELNTISYFDISYTDSVIKNIQDMNYKIYNIDGNIITTMEDLFVLIKEEFPQDPPLSGRVNFDALTDSLWGGFEGQDAEKAAIIWGNPNKLMDFDKYRFEKLIQCIEELAETLTIKEYGIDKPTVLKLVLLGEGPLFSRFDM